MIVTSGFVLAWMITLIKGRQDDQSLSFSPPTDSDIVPTTSFWTGTIPSTLLSRTLKLKLQLNEPQGLVFYAIDTAYNSLWLEFHKTDKEKIIFSYYNFKSRDIDQNTYEFRTLCSLQRTANIIISLRLSLVADTITLYCNRNKERLLYSPNTKDFINEESLKLFYDFSTNPIPPFNRNVSNKEVTYIWIGNTPTTVIEGFRNTKALSQVRNILGCVQSLVEGSSTVKLASSGIRYGNMIEPFCRPVCITNPCNNNAQCVERWRGRFSCSCGLSRFSGEVCNETFGVEFNGKQSVRFNEEYKLQTFQVTFNKKDAALTSKSLKVFSIDFIFNQHLEVVIDDKGLLLIKFFPENGDIIDLALRLKVENGRFYTLFFETQYHQISFKVNELINSTNNFDEGALSGQFPNLVTTSITIGDSSEDNMGLMDRFRGCISNVILTSGKRRFTWNTIQNFDKLPSCKNQAFNMSSDVLTNRSLKEVRPAEDVSMSANDSNKKAAPSKAAFYVIGMVGLTVVAIITTVTIYKYKIGKYQNDKAYSDRWVEKKEAIMPSETVSYRNVQEDFSFKIPYKPAYRAGSASNSLNNVRSVTSLPTSVTSRLILAETEDL